VAVLSGAPLIVLPFLAAAELGYLGFLGMNPRFQNVLKGLKKVPPPLPVDPRQRFKELMAFLNPVDANRFESLRQRCAELVNLRRSMDTKEGTPGVGDFRGESLDRMLWLFLKLLHQRSGLEKFLAATRHDQIETELRSAQTQLATAQERDKSAGLPESRLATSIRDRLTTIQERLDNYRRAADSLELVSAEIDKTEQQITHLCEVGMTMSDSAGLSVQIDSISSSLQASEKIFSQNSFSQIYDDEAPPPMLSGTATATAPRAAVSQ
jgi:chromosome segregation ATPase